MLYVIYAQDKADSWEVRKATREDHLARLRALDESGRLLVAGPCPRDDSPTLTDNGVSGSVIIAEFASLAEAEQWAGQDPYKLAGVYHKVTVKPFIKALPL